MRKVLIALVLTFVGITAFAQRQGDSRTPEERAQGQTKSLTESLKLTEDQQKQVYTLNLDRAKQMEELRKSQTQDREKMRTSMETYNVALTKILTPEQQEAYKKSMEERRSRGGERRQRN